MDNKQVEQQLLMTFEEKYWKNIEISLFTKFYFRWYPISLVVVYLKLPPIWGGAGNQKGPWRTLVIQQNWGSFYISFLKISANCASFFEISELMRNLWPEILRVFFTDVAWLAGCFQQALLNIFVMDKTCSYLQLRCSILCCMFKWKKES